MVDSTTPTAPKRLARATAPAWAPSAAFGGVIGAAVTFAAAMGLRDQLNIYPALAAALLLIVFAVLTWVVAMNGGPATHRLGMLFSFALLGFGFLALAYGMYAGPQRVKVHWTAAPAMDGVVLKVQGHEVSWNEDTYLAEPYALDLDLNAVKRFYEDQSADVYKTAFISGIEACPNIGPTRPKGLQ